MYTLGFKCELSPFYLFIFFPYYPCNCVLFDRTHWRCAHVKMSLRASCLRFATSTPWWLRGESLDLKVGTGAIRSTPETSPSQSTSSTTIWRPTLRWGLTASVSVAVNGFEDEKKSEKAKERVKVREGKNKACWHMPCLQKSESGFFWSWWNYPSYPRTILLQIEKLCPLLHKAIPHFRVCLYAGKPQ